MTAPNTSRLSTFNSIVSTTLENMASEIIDNISQHIPLFNKLYKQGNVKLDGGTEIVRTIEYLNNATYSRITGYDKFDVTPTDPFSAVNYQYKQVVVSVSTSDEELWKNSGKEKIIDLAESKAKNARRSIIEGLDADLWSDGTGYQQIGGLKYLVPLDPTASSSPGGIDQSTWEFWRSVKKATSDSDITGAVMSSTNALSAVRKMKHFLTRNEMGPSFVLCPNDEWDFIAAALETNGRYAGDKSSIDAGFESIKYIGLDFINAEEADGNITDTYLYFLDPETLFFVIHKDRNMVPLEGERTITDQAAMIKPITFVGNLVATCRRNQGLLVNA